MDCLLTPATVSADETVLWIGAIGDDVTQHQFALRSGTESWPLDADWMHWASDDGRRQIAYRRVTIPGRQSRTTYRFELLVDGQPVPNGDASVTTLPSRLPTQLEKPFTALLASCFSLRADIEGLVGRTYALISAGERPEVKLLCGDQVYLDAPWQYWCSHVHSATELQTKFFDNYAATWSHTRTLSGFRELLKHGANYLLPDDHELWNNAPLPSFTAMDSWNPFGHAAWLKAAKELYEVFQGSDTVTTFSVPPVSFLLLDTRRNRASSTTRLMLDQDLDAVRQWVATLQGPGILALGQPLFANTTGWRGTFTDLTLPDFEQYADLVNVLVTARHSLLVVSGDVHFGRVARATLPAGVDLVEVVASPQALVDPKAAGTWEEAPSPWPPPRLTRTLRTPVHTESHRTTEAHFVTLELSAVGQGVDLKVKVWPTQRPTPTPSPEQVFSWILR